MLRRAVLLIVLSSLASAPLAQAPRPAGESVAGTAMARAEAGTPRRSAPFETLGEDRGQVRLRVRDAVLAELAAQPRARLPLRIFGGEELELRVVRLPEPFVPGAPILVDGRPHADVDATSLWAGTVEGEADTEVFLALSSAGSRGWIRRGTTFLHLVAGPGPDGRWRGAETLLIRDVDLLALDLEPGFVCATDELARLGGPRALPRPGSGSLGLQTQAARVLEVEIAVETDFQYYQLFGDLPAALAYVKALFGAVSLRYRQQIGTVLSMSYLALYTTNGDPWVQQDIGGNCIDVLLEFQNAWNSGAAPVLSDLYHLVSGADLGCGVAWLPGLCDPLYGFAVSGNVDGGVPFPVGQGPLNWDFMVLAHELGHNFGSPHTHDYCPPLDECAPPGYFGACQSQASCVSNGTVMSYCHLCPGGLANITTYFHPANVADMRNLAESVGCVDPYVRRP